MKNFLKMFILAAGLVLCLNASSFASIDLAVWNGNAFDGNVRVKLHHAPPGAGHDTEKADYTATQIGFKAHYNLELSPAIDLGLGVFYQYARIPHATMPIGYDDPFTRNSLGVDVAFIFSIASMPQLFPYVRVCYSFLDFLKFDKDYDASGDGVGIGAGLELGITQNARIFFELMYEKGWLEKKDIPGYDKIELNANQTDLNIGLKLLF